MTILAAAHGDSRRITTARDRRSVMGWRRAAADFGATWVAWAFAFGFGTTLSSVAAIGSAAAAALATILITFTERGYSGRVGISRVLGHRLVLRAGLVVAVALLVVDQVIDSEMAIGAIAFGAVLALAGVQAGRFLVDRREHRLYRSGALVHRVLVVADDQAAGEVLDLVDAHGDEGWRTAACIGRCGSEAAAHDVHHLGPSGDVIDAARRCNASVVVIAADALRDEATYAQVLALRHTGMDVRVHAGLRGLDHREVRVAPIGHDALLCLDHPRLLGCQRFAKRILDLTVATITLAVLSPAIALIALAIKLEDRGPVLFRQRRVGRHGTTFLMPKFRSMSVDAEQQIDAVMHLNEREGGPLFKIDNDPRVTRVGKLMRASSIDELPQLVSVLRGEMSLIGPRPALPTEVTQFDARLAARHEVRPGLTGLWQVEQRDSSSFEAYRRLDVYYVENWSLLLDLTILVHTLPAVIGRAWRALHAARTSVESGSPVSAEHPHLEVPNELVPNELMAS